MLRRCLSPGVHQWCSGGPAEEEGRSLEAIMPVITAIEFLLECGGRRTDLGDTAVNRPFD